MHPLILAFSAGTIQEPGRARLPLQTSYRAPPLTFPPAPGRNGTSCA
ncbi:hypothetical protein [Hymenobacter cellulosivorans]|uniref:Uncharacterized protein n=1 Tax=Hymenobacter cellulosivorans TaxID=2932249 RepID=A0ABY4FDH3_9BACT|nr:hypothetical protein [Hymenobacter cellulosivorans]UOQ52511.1 hypothetical protein MUN80_22515 [Hymenobacter cellulosivorans]